MDNASLIEREPTWLINGIESVLAFAASLGFTLTQGQHDNLILIAGVVFAVGNLAFAWYQRRKVFAPATVNTLLAAQVPPPVEPPSGTPAG